MKIKVGLDIATNTGICVLEVDNNNNIKRVLFCETRQLYFKDNGVKTCSAISNLIFEIGEQIQISDEISFYLEYSKYGNYTSGMFGIMIGMFQMLIGQNYKFCKLKLIDPNNGHRKLFPNAQKNDNFKMLSLNKANEYLPYHISDDNQSDAFCLAYFGDYVMSNQDGRKMRYEKRQKEKSRASQLLKGTEKFREGTLKKQQADENCKLISNRENQRRIEECIDKLTFIEQKILELKNGKH